MKSFGHTGFTGTLAWADPEKNIVLIFLSNRIHPKADNKKLIEMNIRTELMRLTFDMFDNEVLDFFEAPVDQIVGVTLLAKLDAIGGENMKVDALEIESWQGENLSFMITDESPEWAILQGKKIKDPWWHDASPRISNFTKDKLTWEEIGFKIDNNEGFRVIQGGE